LLQPVLKVRVQLVVVVALCVTVTVVVVGGGGGGAIIVLVVDGRMIAVLVVGDDVRSIRLATIFTIVVVVVVVVVVGIAVVVAFAPPPAKAQLVQQLLAIGPQFAAHLVVELALRVHPLGQFHVGRPLPRHETVAVLVAVLLQFGKLLLPLAVKLVGARLPDKAHGVEALAIGGGEAALDPAAANVLN